MTMPTQLSSPQGSNLLSAVRLSITTDQLFYFYAAIKTALRKAGDDATTNDLAEPWRTMANDAIDGSLKVSEPTAKSLATTLYEIASAEIANFIRNYDSSAVKGDVAGHAFHGNQYTGGEGGDRSDNTDDYHMTHTAPDPEENAPMHDLTGGGMIYPNDVYGSNAERLYVHGEAGGAESLRVAQSVRDNPDAKVTIYRGVPQGVDKINPGDWVTPSKAYAEQHVQSNVVGGRVISQEVRAGDLWTNGDSINEWGWHPSTAAKGDVDGHAFHGNQWTSGEGGSEADRPDHIAFIEGQASKFEAAGGKVSTLSGDDPKDAEDLEALREDASVQADGIDARYDALIEEGNRTNNPDLYPAADRLAEGIAYMENAVNGEHVIAARDANGTLVAAINYAVDPRSGDLHVGLLGSNQNLAGAATACQLALAREAARLGVGVSSEATPDARAYHERIGRNMGREGAGFGGKSTWTAEQCKEIAKINVMKARKAAPKFVVDEAHQPDPADLDTVSPIWSTKVGQELWEEITSGKAKKGDVAGHAFHGNQWTSGESGDRPDNHAGDGPHEAQGVRSVTAPDGVVTQEMGPLKVAEDGAKAYSAANGIDRPDVNFDKVFVDTQRAQEIAKSYDALPADDPAAHAAYQALANEVDKQYEYMTKTLGVNVDVVKTDPYKDVADLRRDIEQNGRLAVLATETTGAHPFLTNEQNDKFRAVHDYFGHAATGRGFDRHGEEAAWVSHSMMFSPLARQAMTTETRGQNSVLTQEQQGFPQQKVAVLPAPFTDPSSLIEAIKKMLMALFGRKALIVNERNCTAGPAKWDYMHKLGRWSDNATKSRSVDTLFRIARRQLAAEIESVDAEIDALLKGDLPGHPFHGNQHTGGIGGDRAEGPPPEGMTSRDRQDEALRLRQTGMTLQQIADKLNFVSPQAARQGILAAQARADAGGDGGDAQPTSETQPEQPKPEDQGEKPSGPVVDDKVLAGLQRDYEKAQKQYDAVLERFNAAPLPKFNEPEYRASYVALQEHTGQDLLAINREFGAKVAAAIDEKFQSLGIKGYDGPSSEQIFEEQLKVVGDMKAEANMASRVEAAGDKINEARTEALAPALEAALQAAGVSRESGAYETVRDPSKFESLLGLAATRISSDGRVLLGSSGGELSIIVLNEAGSPVVSSTEVQISPEAQSRLNDLGVTIDSYGALRGCDGEKALATVLGDSIPTENGSIFGASGNSVDEAAIRDIIGTKEFDGLKADSERIKSATTAYADKRAAARVAAESLGAEQWNTYRELRFNTLAALRPLGEPGQLNRGNIQSPGGGRTKAGREEHAGRTQAVIDEATGRLPRDWINAMNEHNPQGLNIQFVKGNAGGWYQNLDRQIKVKTLVDDTKHCPSTLLHEMTHNAQASIKDIGLAERAFFSDRTTGRRVSIGAGGRGDPDNFNRAYTGRAPYQSGATEIGTTGMEAMISPTVGLGSIPGVEKDLSFGSDQDFSNFMHGMVLLAGRSGSN